jgi:hypothetical protein
MYKGKEGQLAIPLVRSNRQGIKCSSVLLPTYSAFIAQQGEKYLNGQLGLKHDLKYCNTFCGCSRHGSMEGFAKQLLLLSSRALL